MSASSLESCAAPDAGDQPPFAVAWDRDQRMMAKILVSAASNCGVDLVQGTLAAVAAVCCVALVLAALVTALVIRRRRAFRLAHDVETIESALSKCDAFHFPLNVIRASDFLRMEKLMIYEDVRRTGQHEVHDLVADAQKYFGAGGQRLIFLSHQWLSFDEPDPNGVQYRVMAASVKIVAARQGWDLSKVWVWVDYSSIPQKHKPSQLAAINSLALYASIANALVIAAPPAEHVSTGAFASAHSYQRRSWCRAEQVCYAVRRGAERMFLATSETEIALVDNAWVETSLLVFEGEMTCCAMKHRFSGVNQPCDRLALLQPILGLYGQMRMDKLHKLKCTSSSFVEKWRSYNKPKLDEIEKGLEVGTRSTRKSAPPMSEREEIQKGREFGVHTTLGSRSSTEESAIFSPPLTGVYGLTRPCCKFAIGCVQINLRICQF